MFYEFSSDVSREGWKYPYKGSELLQPSIDCRNRYRSAELEARNRLADLMRDATVNQSDERISTLKRDIERNGKQAEACSVFVTGFRRQPEREFLLAIGDVVFFGLCEPFEM